MRDLCGIYAEKCPETVPALKEFSVQSIRVRTQTHMYDNARMHALVCARTHTRTLTPSSVLQSPAPRALRGTLHGYEGPLKSLSGAFNGLTSPHG